MKTTTKMKPRTKPAAPTREALLKAIGEQFDLADTAFAKPRRLAIRLSYSHIPVLDKAVSELETLIGKLEGIENPKREWDHPGAVEAIIKTFGEPGGSVPRWSRPGEFLLWVDYVPVRCVWQGLPRPSGVLFAVDPTKMWFTSAGALDVRLPDIQPQHATVADLFRSLLATLHGRALKLEPLDDDAIDAAQQTLADAPWLAEALKRGSVDPVPLPRHLQAVQGSLFR
jgi:hypothetical protein